jgi:hypothetical protein
MVIIFKTETLIAKKQFYYGTTLPPETITRNNLVSLVMDHWKSMRPFSDFLTKAIT